MPHSADLAGRSANLEMVRIMSAPFVIYPCSYKALCTVSAGRSWMPLCGVNIADGSIHFVLHARIHAFRSTRILGRTSEF